MRLYPAKDTNVHLPSKAIIWTPTKEEAVTLCAYLGMLGCLDKEEQSVAEFWTRFYGSGLCYAILSPDEFGYGPKVFFESNPEYQNEDPAWNFISTAEFIARCSGCDLADDDHDISNFDIVL